MAVDMNGNLWCGFGSSGAAGADLQDLDGVRVYSRRRSPAGSHRAARALRKRLFWRCSTTTVSSWLPAIRLYALYLSTSGVLCSRVQRAIFPAAGTPLAPFNRET